jgi:hypothetical protein
MKVGQSGGLARRPLTGTWFRIIRLKHLPTRLSSDHSRTARSRYSAASPANPRYRIVYLGGDHQVAIHEARALVGDPLAPVANPNGSWVILGLQVVLDHVVDLKDPSQQKILSTNHAELTGNWANDPGVAPTQALGQALYDLPDLEGFIYPSSLVNGRCLGLFSDKLGPRSSVTFFNEMTGRQERLA